MKINKLILVSIVLLTLISLGAASAASDNVTADNLQIEMEEPDSIELSVPLDDEITADGDDIAVSNDGNSKLSAADDTILSEGEGQNDPKNYTGITVDELTIDDEGASVYNCTIGNLTVNSANVNIFNNTLSNLILNGIKGNIYDNTVSGDIILGGSNVTLNHNDIRGVVTVNGDDSKVFDNAMNILILNGDDAVVANNDLSCSFEKLMQGIMIEGRINGVGNRAKIRNNTVFDLSLTGNDITVYENTITSFTIIADNGGINLTGDNVVVYNNDIDDYSFTQLSGNNIIAHDNTINTNGKDLILPGNNITLYKNRIMTNSFTVGKENGNAADIYDNTFLLSSEDFVVIINNDGSKFHNNTIDGSLTITGKVSVAYTLNGFNVTLSDSDINGTVTVNGAGANLHDNTVTGDIYLNGVNAVVYNNYLNELTFDMLNEGIMSIGTITGFGAGAKIYNNTATLISLTGNDIFVNDNSIAGLNFMGNEIILNGKNVRAYNNTCVGGISLTGDNAIAYDNEFGGNSGLTGNNITFYNNIANELTVGEKGSSISSEIHDNVLTRMVIYGDGAIVYNNSVKNGLQVYADNSVVYNNNVTLTINSIGDNGIYYGNYAGEIRGSGNTLTVYNNRFEGKGDLNIFGGSNSTIYNNIFAHQVWLGSRGIPTAINITFVNNTVDVVRCSDEEKNKWAIKVINSNNNTITGNKLVTPYGKYGDDAVDAGSEKIEGNSPFKPTIIITANNITVNDDYIMVKVTVNGYPNNNLIKIIVNDEIQTIGYVGNALAFFYDLPAAGEYPVIVMTEAFGDYGEGINSTIVKISKLNPDLNLNVSDAIIGEDVNVSANISGATGNVTFIIDGVENDVELIDGVAIYTIKNIVAGDHSIVAIYDGDAKNEAISNFTAFTLTKATPSVDVAIGDLKLGEDATVTVTITNATGKVNIIIDGVESAADLVDGIATATISKVTVGTHTVVASYAGDAKNNAVYGSASKTLNVLSTEITDVNIDGDLNINAVLKDSNGKGIENATILYKMGTQNATVTTGINGTFTIKGEENTKVEISFAGNDLLSPVSTVISLGDVAPTRVASKIIVSQLTCNAVDTSAGEKGAMFKVTLKDASNNIITNASVQIALNGKIYDVVTDANGIASLQVNINKANTYTCAVSYLGDVKHDASFTAVKVVVNKKATKLAAKKKTFKAKVKTKKYAVTLKTTTKSMDGKTYLAAGKKVKLTVKGKTYTAKTNKNGKVTFKITKLNKKGKYTATIKFAGDNTYKGVTKKVKITVKK